MGTFTRVCLIAVSPSLFNNNFFFTTSLCSDRNKPQRRYCYSLDHNDKTLDLGSMGATPPFARREKKIDNGTAIRFFFGNTVYPPALPFSASFRTLGRQPEAARADASRRRNDEKPGSIPDNRKNGRRKRKITWNARLCSRMRDACTDRPG
jgi:hypothetical protein